MNTHPCSHLDSSLLKSILKECKAPTKPRWTHDARIYAQNSYINCPHNYELRAGNAIGIKGCDGVIFLEHLKAILQTGTVFSLKRQKDSVVASDESTTFTMNLRPLRETDTLLFMLDISDTRLE